ncbi:hypothetical protein MRX96_011041 [Rhipicephalus microplus]
MLSGSFSCSELFYLQGAGAVLRSCLVCAGIATLPASTDPAAAIGKAPTSRETKEGRTFFIPAALLLPWFSSHHQTL